MTVDTANETFSFEGSDTGSGQYYAYENHYEVSFRSGTSGTWLSGGPGAVEVQSAFTDMPLAYVTIHSDDGIGLGFSSDVDGADILSITANNTVSFNYSGWSAEAKAALEAAATNNATMIRTTGSGYNSVSMQAIPEPATIGLFGIFGLGLLKARRVFKR